MAKKGILFVDDEPNILSGIKRMLHSMRKKFTFYFAESGIEALALMEEHDVDIVVSDMRMPGMDGAELLKEVQQRFPHAIRIMLSGQASEEALIRTVNIIHIFLDKPCNPERLKEILHRSDALIDQISTDPMGELIASIDTLPCVPAIYTELQEVLSQVGTNIDDVVRILEQDTAMNIRLIQLVNSSLLGTHQTVESLEEVAKLVGFETIKTLILGIHFLSKIQLQSPESSLESLWEHSMVVAQCSQEIGIKATGDPECHNYFLAGMLHDIGRLLLASEVGHSYLPLIKKVREDNGQLFTEELDSLKVSHCNVGAYFVELWGFNIDIMEAIAFHHDIDAYPGKSFSTALAVHIADVFYYKHNPEQSIGQPPTLNHKYIDALGYGDKLESWFELCQSIMTNSENN